MKEIDTAFEALQEQQATEIFPGITTEEIRAIFFDTNALREPPYRIYQLNTDSYRYYYRFNEAGEPQFYPALRPCCAK